ncbi:MAG: AAA family ATPase [Nitrospirae bacterium]|nr:AAA family ATPase [Nitrospirota bacterium]
MENLDIQSLARMIGAGANLIYVQTDNERRTEGIVVQASLLLKGMGSPYIWTCTEGFSRDGSVVPDTIEPLKALDFALAHPATLIFLFKDLTYFLKDNPYVVRKLKDFSVHAKQKAIVLIGQDEAVTEAIGEDLTIFHQGLPLIGEITGYLEEIRKREPLLAEACAADPELLGRLVVAAQGLDLADIDRGVRALRLISDAKGEDILPAILRTKQMIIRKSGIMEFVVNDVRPDQIGGVENLKQWMERRESAFGIKNITSGASLPKGILLMGITGCGKSLFVKIIAAKWSLPLIRLDMSAVYGGGHGSPESSLRKAFRTAEAVAPCVLWIDEIEAGISSHGFKEEGGPVSRVLGSFLIWMQEKRAPVFVAATANAIEMLPAEVIRKGRFDEIFYVGLPDLKGREEIFRVHLAKQKIAPKTLDISLLADMTSGYSGAEIEQAILTAIFEALAEHRPMVQQDLMVAFSRTVPLSVTMAEQIKKTEAWAYKRAVPASGKYKR